MLVCCKAAICTECYLQVQSPNADYGNGEGNPCPFCNQDKMRVKVDDMSSLKNETDSSVAPENDPKAIDGVEDNAGITEETITNRPKSSSFGSNLDAHLLMRSRSRSISSDVNKENNHLINMTTVDPEERKALEEEMRSQRNHPLMRKMAEEADRERERHQLEHLERSSSRRRTSALQLARLLRRSRPADVEREYRSIHERVGIFTGFGRDELDENEDEERSNIDDVLRLEAALLLNMREGLMRHSTSSDDNGRHSDRRDGTDNRISRRRRLQGSNRLFLRHNEDDSDNSRSRARGRDRDMGHHGAQNFMEDLLRERGRLGQRPDPFTSSGFFDDHMPPREAMLAEISEAAQLEMAIQLSLQESHQQRPQSEEVHTQSGDVSNDSNTDNGEPIDHGEEEIVFE